jgi:hypothetical protein
MTVMILTLVMLVGWLCYRTRNFRMAGVEPVMVFSGHGSSLKIGQRTMVSGCDDPEASIERGRRLLECMRMTSDTTCRQKIRHEAVLCFQRGLRVTPEVEKNCIAALRRVGVTVVVAPYGADAQLAYLCRSGICHAALTEDPNLILYGAISELPFPMLYRFDSTGMVRVVSLRNFATSSPKMKSTHVNHKKNIDSNTPAAKSTTVKSYPTKIMTRPSIGIDVHPPVPLPAPINENITSNSSILPFLCQLLQSVHGRRLLIQMCLLLGNEYIEPIFDGITPATAQRLVVKFSEVHPDQRLAAMKQYVDARQEAREQMSNSPSSLTKAYRTTTPPRSPKSISSTYLDRFRRIEVMLHYHPIIDVKFKCVKNYSTPNYTPIDVTTTNVNEYPYPTVTNTDIFQLGHRAHLLHGVPDELKSAVTVENLCAGVYSVRGFQFIQPYLPWEHPHIAQFSDRQLHRPSNRSGQVVNRGVWHNRMTLMRSVAGCMPGSGTPGPVSSSLLSTQTNLRPQCGNTPIVSSLLSPWNVGVSRIPPSSSVFKQECDRFQREYTRVLEAHKTAALKRQSSSSSPNDTCYKSPPTRKAEHSIKTNVSPMKGEIITVDTECKDRRRVPSQISSQENITQNVIVITADAVVEKNATSSNNESPPLHTPPAPLLSTSPSMPLSPDLMRLATVSTVTSPVIERTKSKVYEDRSMRSAAQGKRKHCNFSDVDPIDSKDSDSIVCKKKRHVVNSIKSYFKTSPSVV